MTLITYNGRTILIPNLQVFTATIINNMAADLRRSSLTIGIDYDTDIASVKAVICQATMSQICLWWTQPKSNFNYPTSKSNQLG
jgi:small-conductance mechanosensitive channel